MSATDPASHSRDPLAAPPATQPAASLGGPARIPAALPPATRDAIARMRRRIRALRALRGALELSMYGAGHGVLVLLAAKTHRLADPVARRLLLASLAYPALGALLNALRPVRPLRASKLLDHAYDLHDRLSNALEFAALPDASRSTMMAAAIEDADEHARAKRLAPSKALRVRLPGEAPYALALVAVMGLVALVEVRTAVPIARPVTEATVRDPLELTDDDVDAFRQFAQQMGQRDNTEQTRQALDRFNRFIDQIADRRLDRQEAFRQLQQLQEELERGREDDREALRDALREIGRRLDREEVTRPLAQAMQNADPQRAAEEMRRLAEQLRENRLSQQQRENLQNALRQATERRENQELQQQLQRQREEIERLLRQQRERDLSQSEQRLLRQRQREAQRLERQQQRQEQQRRQTQRLDRAMSQAMQDLLRDIAQAARDMEQGAEDLSRMQNEQLSEQQLADLRQQLEDLRQRMRQQNGQNGQSQRQRLERFAGRARGGVQPGGQQPGGRGRLVLGPGGMRIPVPMQGQGGQGQGQGQQGQGQGQQGQGQQGDGAGTEHDENIRGASTNINARMRTVNVTGQQRGNGPTRSQVIRTAAQEGFTTQGYREVYPEYWEHAREVVHAGEVPPGYRSYVRRYFQLIRPRDD